MTLMPLCAHGAMPDPENSPSLYVFTTNITTSRGRVVVHILKNALLHLGAGDEAKSLASTLRRHMPKLRALALQLAHRENTNEVHIGKADVWWPPAP